MLKRSEAYEVLFRLKQEKNLDIEEQLEALTMNTKVPKKVLQFIENNSTRTLDDFIKNIARSKNFFQNICFNYQQDISTYIKAFLSLITHLKITIDKNPELQENINAVFDVDRILNVVKVNLKNGNNDKEVYDMAKDLKIIFLNEEELNNGGDE